MFTRLLLPQVVGVAIRGGLKHVDSRVSVYVVWMQRLAESLNVQNLYVCLCCSVPVQMCIEHIHIYS